MLQAVRNVKLAILAFVIVFAAGLMVIQINKETVDHIDSYPAEVHIPNHCWTGGEGHPYPNQVKYNGTIRGQKVVDSLIKEIFENRSGPYNPGLIQYFCKR